MKRIFTIVAVAAALTVSVDAGARGGIIGGFTSSKTDISNFDPKSVSLFHVGVTYQMKLLGGFTLQPSLIYQVKGATLEDYTSGTAVSGTIDARVGYLEVPVSVQWGPDLLLARPYVFLEPFVGYGVNVRDNSRLTLANLIGTSLSDDQRKKLQDEAVRKIEYGLGLGVGVEVLRRLQVSLQYFWNFGALASSDGTIDGATVLGQYETAYKNAFNGNSFNGVKLCAAIFF